MNCLSPSGSRMSSKRSSPFHIRRMISELSLRCSSVSARSASAGTLPSSMALRMPYSICVMADRPADSMQNSSVSGSGSAPTRSVSAAARSGESKSSSSPHVMAQWMTRLITGGQSRMRLCVPSMSWTTWVIRRRPTGLMTSMLPGSPFRQLSSKIAMAFLKHPHPKRVTKPRRARNLLTPRLDVQHWV